MPECMLVHRLGRGDLPLQSLRCFSLGSYVYTACIQRRDTRAALHILQAFCIENPQMLLTGHVARAERL